MAALAAAPLQATHQDIIEALPRPAGMAAVGIPDYRLPPEIIGYECGLIEKLVTEHLDD